MAADTLEAQVRRLRTDKDEARRLARLYDGTAAGSIAVAVACLWQGWRYWQERQAEAAGFLPVSWDWTVLVLPALGLSLMWLARMGGRLAAAYAAEAKRLGVEIRAKEGVP